MSDDDLIRRGAALKEVDMWESDWVSTDCAIRALPAVTQPAPDSADRIEALTEQLDATLRYAEEAEACAEKLKAKLAKAVEALQIARVHVANNAEGWSVSRAPSRDDLMIVDFVLSVLTGAKP